MIRIRVGGLFFIVCIILFFGGLKWVCGQTPVGRFDIRGKFVQDINIDPRYISIRSNTGLVQIISVAHGQVATTFQLPTIPEKSICIFLELNGGKRYTIIQSIVGADYMVQICDMNKNILFKRQGMLFTTNNLQQFLILQTPKKLEIYNMLDVISSEIKPKIKYKSLKSVVVRSVYDSRGIVIPKGLLSSGFYVDLKNKNRIIYVK